MKVSLCFILLFLPGLFSFSQSSTGAIDHRFFNDLKTTENPGCWINLDTRVEDANEPGNFYSSIDSKHPYGLGLETTIPDDLKNRNMYLSIRARLRVSDSTQNVQLVTSISHGDSTVLWKGVNIAQLFGKIHEWVPVKDSLLIPRNIPVDSKIKIYLWNQDGKAEAGLDDLEIQMMSYKIPSYLIY
ncbi:MAG: hypothetical protein NT126_00790 [Bacteroidetes bacterium]|nr:hypothetical protein [Bacteroidota bacterium]